jgi:hypothetical protein
MQWRPPYFLLMTKCQVGINKQITCQCGSASYFCPHSLSRFYLGLHTDLNGLWEFSTLLICKCTSNACIEIHLESQSEYFIHLFSFSVVLGGVHCGIYKSSYNVSNISYLNSSPQPLSFIVPPWLMEQFQQVSFFHLHTCLYIIWTLFTLLSLPSPLPHYTAAPILPHSTC